jgi:hypothetical protein
MGELMSFSVLLAMSTSKRAKLFSFLPGAAEGKPLCEIAISSMESGVPCFVRYGTGNSHAIVLGPCPVTPLPTVIENLVARSLNDHLEHCFDKSLHLVASCLMASGERYQLKFCVFSGLIVIFSEASQILDALSI